MLYSLAKVAEILGISRRTMARQMASCQNYQEVGQGGQKMYPLTSFPEQIQAKIQAAINSSDKAISPPGSETMAIIAPPPKPKKHKPLPPPNSPKLAVLDAWHQILQIQSDWCKTKNLSPSTCDKQFAQAVANNEIPHIDTLKAAIAWGNQTGISHSSLARYRKRFSQDGLNGLLRNTSKLATQGKIESNPQLQESIIGHITSYPAATITRLYKEICKIHGAECTSLSALRNWLKHWITENQSTYLYITDRDKWNNTYLAAFGTHNDTLFPNHIWELDSTPADLALPDGRHCALALIDVYTRRAQVLVNKTSTAAAVLSLLRNTMIAWGLPTAIRTDNGSDYVSKAVQRFCAQMGIQHLICTPGTPQAKPYIERFFGTYSHDVMPLLPGYLGHNVATATRIRGGQKGKPIIASLDIERFQAWTDEWLTEYNSRPHAGMGKSPAEALQVATTAGWQPRQVSDIRELDLLLTLKGKQKIQKAGIRHLSTYFIAPDLPIGDWVWVCLDVADLGKIYWFAEDNTYGGEAIAAELLGIDQRQIALEARRAQLAEIRDGKRIVAKAKRSIKQYRIKAIHRRIAPDQTLADESNVVAIADHQAKKQKAIEGSKWAAKGCDEAYYVFAEAWLAGNLAAAIQQWDQERMANIAARSTANWREIAPEMRVVGINKSNAEEFFGIVATLANQQINLVQAN
jgi:putative transposase